MNKETIKEYIAIICLCCVVVVGLKGFTKFVDRHADKHYIQKYKVKK